MQSWWVEGPVSKVHDYEFIFLLTTQWSRWINESQWSLDRWQGWGSLLTQTQGDASFWVLSKRSASRLSEGHWLEEQWTTPQEPLTWKKLLVNWKQNKISRCRKSEIKSENAARSRQARPCLQRDKLNWCFRVWSLVRWKKIVGRYGPWVKCSRTICSMMLWCEIVIWSKFAIQWQTSIMVLRNEEQQLQG